MQRPTIGRIVHYHTDESDKRHMVGRANVVNLLPALIVAVHTDDCVNLKVFLDGSGDIWTTQVMRGDDPGEWNWPVIDNH